MAIEFRSEKEYKDGLRRLDALLKFPDGTPEADEADFLLLKVEAWEKPYEPELPDPIEMIKYAMEQRGWTSADLAPLMDRGRVSEVFQKKRSLSLRMIRWFHANLGISLETLVQEYKLAG
jgi:HTH-type transcriptional regulator/antitoxin HigA